ncbi:MAG TPA: hypothetical protein DDX98_01645 [Bacteroidales bacterium]|nr:hypothetical protein [Bacteroidales bacterium]
MKFQLIVLFTFVSQFLSAQIEVPTSSQECKIITKGNITYCLNTSNYEILWAATVLEGKDIDNKVYLPPDKEFFRKMPVKMGPVWQKIEMQTRMWAMEFDSLYVVTGMYYSNDSIPEKLYYKTLLKGSQSDGLAFVVSVNSISSSSIVDYAIPIIELEERTRIDFYPSLNKKINNPIEASLNWENWPLTVD